MTRVQPTGLWRLALEVKAQAASDRLSLVAAGVAFYALLAVFPGLAALVALYGLAFDPVQIERQVRGLAGLLPPQALDLLLGQLGELARTSRGSLGWSAAGGLALTLWSASRGIKTVMQALNIAYDVRAGRGFVARNALALLLTLGAIAGAMLAIALIVALPAALRLAGLGGLLGELMSYGRWPILAATVALGCAILYRYAPAGGAAGAPVAWGALVATALWMGGSVLFSLYVSSFGAFNRTYGSVAAIVVLMLWFLVSAYALLIGAEVNAVLARRPSPGQARGAGASNGMPWRVRKRSTAGSHTAAPRGSLKR